MLTEEWLNIFQRRIKLGCVEMIGLVSHQETIDVRSQTYFEEKSDLAWEKNRGRISLNDQAG